MLVKLNPRKLYTLLALVQNFKHRCDEENFYPQKLETFKPIKNMYKALRKWRSHSN